MVDKQECRTTWIKVIKRGNIILAKSLFPFISCHIEINIAL